MKKNNRYQAPCVTIVTLALEGSAIMGPSQVGFIIMEPDTINQEVDDVDFSDNIFYHEWE